MSRKIIDAEVKINDIEFPNKGIGCFEDEKIVIKNTIPGQVVLAIVKRKKGKFEGRLKEVVKKADYEIPSECMCFELCGGCTYQNIEYKKEMEFKRNNVKKLLKDGGFGDIPFYDIIGCPSIKEYRNKMEFSFGDTEKNGVLALGMRKRNSFYEVVNADNCKIIHRDIQKILSCVRDYFIKLNEPFYHKGTHTGTLRHLIVRRAYFTGEILVNLVTTSAFSLSLKELSDELCSLQLEGKINGFLHTKNDSIADVVKVDECTLIYGKDYIIENLLGLKFKISPFSFFQTNSCGAEKLYDIIRNFAGDSKNKIIFDLYCGTGTIGQIMSKHAKKVIGIEIVEEAIEAAKQNAILNGINNCEFIADDVLKAVNYLDETPDIIILDPPREGIHPKAISKISEYNANTIIYVSCKASSMVNDLQSFQKYGYTPTKIQCIDMFARTYHVETVCLLSKKSE